MLDVEIEFEAATAVRPSPRVLETAVMFGLGVDESRRMRLVPRTRIRLRRGEVLFVTGPSGGGKSTILRLIANAAAAHGLAVIDASHLPEPRNVPLVDGFDQPLEQTMELLARAGLADAFVMLRRPCELSDGQRWRLRIAQMIDEAEQRRRESGALLLIDEFGATLDRLTAKIIARNVSRWVRSARHGLVCATTHDDLLESLEPDVLVYKGLGGEIEIESRK